MRQSFWKPHIVALTALAVAVAIFNVYKVYAVDLNNTDFRYVWLAGKFWRSHLNPYSPIFITESSRVFGVGKELSVWVYPFQWVWLAAPLSFFAPAGGLFIWRCASYALVVASAVLVFRSLALLHVRLGVAWMIGLVAYAMAFNPLGATLQLAQPVIVPAFGFVLLLYGSARHADPIKLAGIVLLALKPQFGLPILLMFVCVKGNFRLYVIGALTTIVLAMPALLMSGMEGQVVGIVRNIVGVYDRVGVNYPIAMIGLPNMLALIAHVDMPVSIGVLLASGFSLSAGFMLQRVTTLTEKRKLIYMAALAALSVSAIVGVHPSDLIVLLVALPLTASQTTTNRVVALLGYTLLCRFENLAKALATIGVPTGIALATLAVFIIALSWGLDLFTRLRGSRGGSDQPG